MQLDRVAPEPEGLSLFNRKSLSTRVRGILAEHELSEDPKGFSHCLSFLNKAATSHFTNLVEELVSASRRRSIANSIPSSQIRRGQVGQAQCAWQLTYVTLCCRLRKSSFNGKSWMSVVSSSQRAA